MNIKIVLIATVFFAVALANNIEEESPEENGMVDNAELKELGLNDVKDIMESDLVRPLLYDNANDNLNFKKVIIL